MRYNLCYFTPAQTLDQLMKELVTSNDMKAQLHKRKYGRKYVPLWTNSYVAET